MRFLLSVPTDRRPRRAAQLFGGLSLYGVSSGLLVVAGLGPAPWDVLHQGLARTVGGGIGTWVIVVGALTLALWIPLRVRPGIGTVANVVMVGLLLAATVAVLPPPGSLPARIALLVSGVALNGLAGGLYIGADTGPGPRDGLMTGLAARGVPLWAARAGIEITVVSAGAALGGTFGPGTVAYAVAIGPITQLALRRCRVDPRSPVGMVPDPVS